MSRDSSGREASDGRGGREPEAVAARAAAASGPGTRRRAESNCAASSSGGGSSGGGSLWSSGIWGWGEGVGG